MLPRALAQPEIIFWSHVAYEMKPMDLGECNGMLFTVIEALYEELKQRENLLCLFIGFFLTLNPSVKNQRDHLNFHF